VTDLRTGRHPLRAGWPLAVTALFVALAGVYIYLGMWRYAIFRAGIDDLIFTQVVNSGFGTFSSTVEGSINHFLVHFSPILYVAVPLVKVFDGARGLILLQCLLAAATIFPVWRLASARFAKPLAFAVTLVAAIYPPLSAEAVGDFHELAFVPPLAATLVWAIDCRRWRAAIAVTVLLAAVKEDQFVSLAFIGVAVAIMAQGDRAMRRCGLWIFSIAVVAAVLYFGIVRPLIDPHAGYFSLHFYQWWRFPPTAAGFAGPLSTLRPQYLFALLLPLAFLPLASRYMIFAIPGLAEVLLSHEAITLQLGTQYTATWIGYVLCAFVDGLSRVYSRSMFAARAAIAVAFVASVWTSYYYSPIEPGFALYRRPAPVDRLRERTLSSLPRNASVGSGAYVLAHIAMNPKATVAMSDGEQYLVFDHFTDPGYWIAADRPTIQRLIERGAYARVYDAAGIVILERKRSGFST
jgi:uncharacterized membrane protein